MDENRDIERTAVINISYSESISATATIIQSAIAETIYVEPKEVTIPCEGGQISVTVHSSRKWNLLEKFDWINVDITSGDTDDAITFIIAPNVSKDRREAIFTLRLINSESSVKIKITQLKNDVIDSPTDSNPACTSFDRKIMLVDFTGTACVNCPTMLQPLKKVLAKSTYTKKVILAMAHTYRKDDPAYFVSTLQTTMG